MSNRRRRPLWPASWIILGLVALASPSGGVDYVLLEERHGNATGARPDTISVPWRLEGGCISIVGPLGQGGIAGRDVHDMVAFGWGNGPNGVSERGEGDDRLIGPVAVRWTVSDTAWDARSGRYSLTDSPQGLYESSTDYSATIDSIFDLTGVYDAALRFWHHWNFRYNASSDEATVEVRPNGGDWEQVAEFNFVGGFHGLFLPATVDLSPYTDQTVEIRFRFATSLAQVSDGWHLDDVRLLADGEILFQDDFETGTDHWILEGDWGLSLADLTELVYQDRNQNAKTFPVSRDIFGIPAAEIDSQSGRLRTIPVGFPTVGGEGLAYVWVVARWRDQEIGTMIRTSPPSYIPE